MGKIEEVTCIKFEERSKNNHEELISEIVLLENFICRISLWPYNMGHILMTTIFLSRLIRKPRIRITLNSKMEMAAIL